MIQICNTSLIKQKTSTFNTIAKNTLTVN